MLKNERLILKNCLNFTIAEFRLTDINIFSIICITCGTVIDILYIIN